MDEFFGRFGSIFLPDQDMELRSRSKDVTEKLNYLCEELESIERILAELSVMSVQDSYLLDDAMVSTLAENRKAIAACLQTMQNINASAKDIYLRIEESSKAIKESAENLLGRL